MNTDNNGNMSSEETAILIEDNVLKNLKDGYAQLSYENFKLIKYNNDIVQLEEEDEDDVENCTNTDQADYNDEEEYDIEDEEDDERDLTNLTWLTELRNQTMGFVNMALDEEPKKESASSATAVERIPVQPSNVTERDIPFKTKASILSQQNQKNILQVPLQKSDEPRTVKISNQPKRPSPAERYETFLNKIKRDLETYEESAISYQSDVVEKPPFNYSHIIGMAMLENGKRVTLQQICSWIERKFAFFRVRKKWNNSIRHNLSLHPCFRKIGRNKEDKGKGGYWELGVDPKKCDRKRIRNRKSTAQSNKIQKKHLQNHFMKTSKRRQPNNSSMKKFCLKNCNENLRNFSAEQNYEELLLDEMDVQQNIDVISTNSNNNINASVDSNFKLADAESSAAPKSIHQTHCQQVSKEGDEDAMLTNFIDSNDDHVHLQQNDNFKAFNKSCSLASEDICHGSEQFSEQTSQHQQYKLGTIIISSENVGDDMPNIESSNQRTITSFLNPHSRKQLLTEERQCTNSIRYSEFENVPQNDVIISSYIPNLSDDFSTCTHESKSYQCHNLCNSNAANSITLDFSAYPAQSIQYKQNVIVEQLIQEPSLTYSAIKISSDCLPTTSSSSIHSASAATSTQTTEFANGFVNEHFRPYIDGIDEAFQYLRSIDTTRNEDILDNLLDISVSDY